MSSLPITAVPALTAADKLRITLDLAEAGVDMMRENLRRRHPDADAAESQRRLVAWLQERPGAELGDAEGRPGRRSFAAA
jgi:hypothetical protein